jgi:hypothetical protein
MAEFVARCGLRQTMTTTVATAGGVSPAIAPIRVRPLLQPAGYRGFSGFPLNERLTKNVCVI